MMDKKVAMGIAIVLLVIIVASLGEAEEEGIQESPVWVDPYPSKIVDTGGLDSPGLGEISFHTRGGTRLKAFTYRPSGFQPKCGRIWFVIHGVKRTAKSYLRAASSTADRNDVLAIAIDFDVSSYPTPETFNFGIGTGATPEGRVYDPAEWRNQEEYTFSEVEHLFQAIRNHYNGEAEGYYIFGHSAGAQFVQRLITFLPNNRVVKAVAANAGWYTLPSKGSGFDKNYYMKYGLQGSNFNDDDIIRILESPLLVLVAENDRQTSGKDGDLRDTNEANAQGLTRFDRGHFYYEVGQREAERLGADFEWKFSVVPGAGHNKEEMIPSAEEYLFLSEQDRGQNTISAACTD